MDIRDLIIKKRNKEELSSDELEYFINSYNEGTILEEQAASLLTLMYINGLNIEEMTTLTYKAAETGKLQDLYKYSDSIIEYHPIGGLEDKINIAIMAICSALKIPFIKIVDREIGFLDKLNGVNGYKLEFDFDLIREKISNNSLVIINEPENIAPVEKRLYNLRKNLACTDDISLIAMSLMSQKIALGMKNIVFDITYGENTYVKDIKDARRLALYLIKMGKELKKGVRCIISEEKGPIGKFFGNTLELKEAKEILQNIMTDDIREYIINIGDCILNLVNDSKNREENKRIILEAIENGSAYQKLDEFLNQNNNYEVMSAEHIVPVKAEYDGYVEEIDMSIIRDVSIMLNSIRYNKDSYLDVGAGLEFCKTVGDKINKEDIIGYVHTNDMNKIEDAVKGFKEAFIISNKKVKNNNRIKEILY